MKIVCHMMKTNVKAGLHGQGLFAEEDIAFDARILEYTGNRFQGHYSESINLAFKAFKARRVIPYVQCDVGTEDFIIDPRGCGNDARYVNHSCEPNAMLELIRMGDH